MSELTEDRPCSECVWRSETGCVKWNCEPMTRSELLDLLRELKEYMENEN